MLRPHLRTKQAHPLWIDGLRIENGDWVVDARIPSTSDHSVHEPVVRGIEEVCWEWVFNGTQYATLSAGRRCSSHVSQFHWAPAHGELSFSLDEFQPTSESLDAMIFGSGPGKNNPLLALQRGEARYLVPTLTLLSAVAFPTPNVLRALLTPGDFGYEVSESEVCRGTLYIRHTGPWPPSGRSAPRLLRERVHECLAFWLETKERRRSIQRCFHDFYMQRPARLPLAEGRITLRWDGYIEGECRVIERMGAHKHSDIWPHEWTFSELIGKDGQRISVQGARSGNPGSALPWP